jgi:ubiquinone biosynthesis protein
MAAITEDDPVVVTIRRPGLASLVEADLAALRAIVGLIDFLGILGRVRLGRQFQEFRRRTLEGLSLTTEARKAERLAAQTDDNPRQYIPQVYWSHTGRNVLAMERVRGTPLVELLGASGSALSLVTRPGQEPPGATVDLPTVARNLLFNHLHQVLNGKYAHCSPVPAILTVLEDNTIAYRDFRAVERIEPRFTQQQMEVISAARAGDVDSLFLSLWDWVEAPYNSPVEFEDSFHRRVSEWMDLADDRSAAPAERNIRHLIAGIIDDFRRFRIAAPAALLAYYHAFATTALTAEMLAPNLDMDAELSGFFQKMLTERIEKKIDTGTLSQTVLEYEQFLVALPHQFRELLRFARQHQSPVVKSVDLWRLRAWNVLQLAATLTILAIPAAWLWAQWTGASSPLPGFSAPGLIAAVCGLLLLRRVARMEYQECAMGTRRMRQP